MSLKNVNLLDISKPKQWKNLPSSELIDEGYYVYGANGIIGKYSEYNHEFPTLVITCRGATCGNLHITKPKSYINSNAMALDKLSTDVDVNFLYYALLKRGFNDVITGSAQPQITREGLSKIKIPLPPLSDQIHIAEILSQAETLIAQRKQSINLLDELLKSTFLEMFGDPVKNNKKWKMIPLKKFGSIITGNTPPRRDKENYSEDYIEWIKTDNIKAHNLIINKASEFLSEKGLQKSRFVEKGALMVACIAGSIESVGRACITNRKVSFNQQINAIQPSKEINSFFLYWLFKNSKSYIQNHASKGMKKILTKGEFEKILMIQPPIELQIKFAAIVEKVETLKTQYQQSLQELQNMYGALSQKAFKGELKVNSNNQNIAIAAEPEIVYEKSKVIKLIPKKYNRSEKAILAGRIINLTNSEDFGRVKFQKLLYLTEHICKLDLDSNYLQNVAGPHDGQLLTEVETTLKQYRFYDIGKEKKNHSKISYKALSSANELDALFEKNFSLESESINQLLSKFKKSTWEQTEIVATLYAVWNNRLIKQESFTDELLKQDFLAWDEQKIKYKDRLDAALEWMRKKNIVPEGWGKLIEKAKE